MTAPTIVAAPWTAPASPRAERPDRRARLHAVAAGVALLACYVAASFLTDPGGFLGTDTGGKVATLRVMEGADPDLGYWAEEWDPDGALHPLWYTTRVGDRWVNVTTLPMLLAGKPLYDLGGYRAALLLPMLGGVAAAFAARSLARRLVGGQGWAAFWLVGLASPVAVYALDFWEHTVGLALLGWAAVALLDVVDGRAGWRGGLAGGVAIGLAGTMRTEALAYGAVWVVVTCGVLLRRARRPAAGHPPAGAPVADDRAPSLGRSLRAPVAVGLAAAAGVAAPLVANTALERAVLGRSLRTGRATGTVLDSGADGASRVIEALVTSLSPTPTLAPAGWLLGLLLFGALAFLAVRAADAPGRDPFPAVGAALLVVAIHAVVRSDGLGFVPGLVAATPLAAVALALGRRLPHAGPLLAFALVPLPVVWRFQFTGGATPQWAGRYLLATGLLLAVVGICCLPRLATWARVGAVVLSATVTFTGVAWLSERSHDVARAIGVLEERPEDVLVSRVHHLAREGGATYGDRRWLTAITDADVERAAGVVLASGGRSFALVGEAGADPAPPVAGFAAKPAGSVRLFSGVRLTVVAYVAE